jgi:hypothetical protein
MKKRARRREWTNAHLKEIEYRERDFTTGMCGAPALFFLAKAIVSVRKYTDNRS